MSNYRQFFIKSVRENFPAGSDDIIAATDKHFGIISIDTKFAATSANPIDKRLDFSAYFLALIKTLDERGESFDVIRRVSLEVVTGFVRPKSKIHALLKRLPVKLANTWLANRVIRALNKKVSKNLNPAGFVAKIITDKKETLGLGYGVDIIECGICKLFSKHNYSKYASILCEVDAITSGLAGLELVRTGTIALGAKTCDFRFRKL